MSEEILYAAADRVATITLNRPEKLNAWTPAMAEGLKRSVEKAGADDAVGAILITGAGRGFCAGADLDALKARGLRAAPGYDMDRGPDYAGRFGYMLRTPKPIIAAINGPAAGVGFVMTLFCDLRFAAEKARMGVIFARRGLPAEDGSAWLLPRLVGIANAADLLYSGRLIEGSEAHRIGLVSRVFPEASFAEEARAGAVELATLSSPRSIRIMKRQLWEGLRQGLGEAAILAEEELAGSRETEDFREGVASFLEKRPPRFTGR
jgi:enoyl-CoA hydratase/carnithine racemase